MSSNQRSSSRIGSPISLPILAVIAFGVLAIITSSWAVVLHNRTNSLENELGDLRANANASLYSLEPTDTAPNDARGQIFLTITGSGVVTVSNLPQPGDNEAYHLWFLDDENNSTIAGGTLIIDTAGQGFALIPADTAGYTRIAVSLEPSGSTTPGGSFLLTAEVRSGRG